MTARKRKCKHCGDKYRPVNSLQQVCGPSCAIQYGKTLTKKRARKERRVAIQKLKTRGQWAKEAQAAFNAFIRARDKAEPCISCGISDARWNAGHYRPVGSHPELRFDEENCHKQCAQCNTYKSGNTVNYRYNLVLKIGQEAVERLDGPNDPAKYTIEDLQGIKRDYRLKAKKCSLKGPT